MLLNKYKWGKKCIFKRNFSKKAHYFLIVISPLPLPASLFCKYMLIPSVARKLKESCSLCFKLLISNFIDQENFLCPHSLSNSTCLPSSKIKAKFSDHWISYGIPTHPSQPRSPEEKWGCPFSSPYHYSQRTGSLLCTYNRTLHGPLPRPHCDAAPRASAIYHLL